MNIRKLYKVQPVHPWRYVEDATIAAYNAEDALDRAKSNPLSDWVDDESLWDQFTDWQVTETTNEFTFADGTQVYFAVVYSIGCGYGGPEEGGWWFDTGEPILNVPCRAEEVDEVVAKLREQYPDTGKSRSVLGGDDYHINVHMHPGKPFPETRPYYE